VFASKSQSAPLPRVEASRYLKSEWGLSYVPATLAVMAAYGAGPAYRKHGRSAVYEIAALDEWAEDRLSTLHNSRKTNGHGK
jgi:hypothetical protein